MDAELLCGVHSVQQVVVPVFGPAPSTHDHVMSRDVGAFPAPSPLCRWFSLSLLSLHQCPLLFCVVLFCLLRQEWSVVDLSVSIIIRFSGPRYG